MLGFFERQRLVRKGLASGKTRRRRTESELFETLEHGWGARVMIFGVFILGLWGLMVIEGGNQASGQGVDRGLLGVLIFSAALGQLWINHPETWGRNSRLLLLFGVFLVHLGALKAMLLGAEAQVAGTGVVHPGQWSALEKQQLWQVALPLSLAPLTVSLLLGKTHGVYATLFVSLWSSILYRAFDARLLVVSLILGLVGVLGTIELRRRGRLVRAGFFVGLATWALALAFGWIGPIQWLLMENVSLKMLGWQTVVAVGSPMVLAFLVGGGLVPVCESLFGITTNISWLELADLNHPLLKRMTIEAPGTYHHSLVVAHLAEAAAESIGANASMARVGAYFHDIGKLVKPDYFTENFRHDRNPHGELAPTMSALIIIAHVKEGVDLALKHGLNREIVDVIQQHHGTSLVYYFYKRALQQQEDARAGGKIMNIREEDIPEVREESFRYSGPRPQTRECAIISLADCIESASRSIERPTPQKIDTLVRDIIEKRIQEGELRDSGLTLGELEDLAESFKFTLQSMMHSRVAYPSEKSDTPNPASRSTLPMSAA
jgi:putative nucleotidyltransferase with HDIG domain